MSEPFIAEIRIFTYTFAPRDWAYCNGQIMDISQNTSLFALIGTTYGGDGYTTMGIPNLMGRAPMHPGRGPGLSYYKLGQMGGSAGVELLREQIPSHNHELNVSMQAPTSHSPEGLYPARHEDDAARAKLYSLTPNLPLDSTFDSAAVSNAGNDQMHENRQPFLGLVFCIALLGIFPSRG